MPLTFAGLTIPGTVLPWQEAEWDRSEQLTTLFGLQGGAMLFGGRTTRTLSPTIWIHNNYTQSQLDAFLESLDAKIGTTGTLAESGGVSASYPLCYLESVVRSGPRLPPNAHIGWSQRVTLNFRQLQP
jgi:hypothetical protein